MAFAHDSHHLQLLADEVPPFAAFPWRPSAGLKGISAFLPVASSEFPSVSRKESVRGLGFLLPSTRRARGSRCSVPPQAHPPAGPAVPPCGHPLPATLRGSPSPPQRLTQGQGSGQPRGFSAAALVGTDRQTSPCSWTRARPRPWARSRGRRPMRFKGSDASPSYPRLAGAAAPLPLADPAPPASPIGQRRPRPRLPLGCDWLFAISRGTRPFSRLRLARARAPTAL